MPPLVDRMELGSFCLFFLFAVLAFLTLKPLYNIFLHPLRKFPGPKTYAASSIPVALAQLNGKYHRFTQAAHERYGPVVRISPNELSFITAGAWNDIYARSKGGPPFPRDPTFFNDMLVDPRSLTMADDANHARLRRSMNGAFAPRVIAEQEPFLQKTIELFLERLTDRAEKAISVDLRLWYNYATFDLSGDLAFGESFGCLAASTYHVWVQFVLDHFYVSALLQVVHRFAPLNRLLAAMIPGKMMEQRKSHEQLALEKVRRRCENNLERRDFISHLIKARDDSVISTEEMEQQASILILAGSETTSIALTFSTYFLLQNPKSMQRLREELQAQYQQEEDIDARSVNQLPYLHAVIQEALRLSPPITNGFPRQTPVQGGVVDGHHVPGRTVVNISHFSAYRSPMNFFKPNTFHPERWLGDPQFANDARDVFQPFSVGPRNCIGKKFAYDTMKLILARTVWRFDMALTSECENWLDSQPSYVSFHPPPLMANLRRRETSGFIKT